MPNADEMIARNPPNNWEDSNSCSYLAKCCSIVLRSTRKQPYRMS